MVLIPVKALIVMEGVHHESGQQNPLVAFMAGLSGSLPVQLWVGQVKDPYNLREKMRKKKKKHAKIYGFTQEMCEFSHFFGGGGVLSCFPSRSSLIFSFSAPGLFVISAFISSGSNFLSGSPSEAMRAAFFLKKPRGTKTYLSKANVFCKKKT